MINIKKSGSIFIILILLGSFILITELVSSVAQCEGPTLAYTRGINEEVLPIPEVVIKGDGLSKKSTPLPCAPISASSTYRFYSMGSLTDKQHIGLPEGSENPFYTACVNYPHLPNAGGNSFCQGPYNRCIWGEDIASAFIGFSFNRPGAFQCTIKTVNQLTAAEKKKYNEKTFPKINRFKRRIDDFGGTMAIPSNPEDPVVETSTRPAYGTDCTGIAVGPDCPWERVMTTTKEMNGYILCGEQGGKNLRWSTISGSYFYGIAGLIWGTKRVDCAEPVACECNPNKPNKPCARGTCIAGDSGEGTNGAYDCPDNQICFFGCKDDLDCPSDEQCTDGSCVPKDHPIECNNDSDCSSSEECLEGACTSLPVM